MRTALTTTSAVLRRALVNAIMHTDAAGVLVDIAGVTEIDAITIGTLRAAHDLARDRNIIFAVRVAKSPIAGDLARADLPLVA